MSKDEMLISTIEQYLRHSKQKNELVKVINPLKGYIKLELAERKITRGQVGNYLVATDNGRLEIKEI